jgi:hypothetical protein
MIIKTKKGDFPIRYGWAALAKFGDSAGLTMDDVLQMDMKKMKVSDLLKFLLAGFEDGARKEGKECKIKSTDDVADLLDEDSSVVEKAMGAFSDMTKPGEGDSKKK